MRASTRPGRPRLVRAGVFAALGAPLLLGLAALALHGRGWGPPTGDGALLELAVRAVERGDLAVGPYSRFGFRHPGPALPMLLAPGHLLAGGGGRGLRLGALLANGTWLVLALVLLEVRVSRIEWLVGSAALAQLLTWEGRALVSAWNPDLVILALAVTILAAARGATAPGWLALAVLSGSVAVQGHLATAPAVVAALLAGLAGAVWRSRRRETELRRWRERWSWALACGAALLAAWGPVLLAGPEPGGFWNLQRILHVLHRGGWIRSPLEAWRLWTRVVVQAMLPGGTPGPALAAAAGVLPWLVAAAALVVAPRTEQRWRLATCLAALAAGPPAVARVIGPPEPYLLRWMVVPALLTLGWGLGILGERVSSQAGRWIRRAGTLLLVTVFLGPVALGLGLVTAEPGITQVQRETAHLAAAAAAALEGEIPGPVAVRFAGRQVWEVWAGVLNELDRRGNTVSVDPDRWFEVPRRFVTEKEPPASAIVLLPADLLPRLPRNGGLRMLAREGRTALVASDLGTPRVGRLPLWAVPLWARRWSGLGPVNGAGPDLFRWSEGPHLHVEIAVGRGDHHLWFEGFAYPSATPQVVRVTAGGRRVGRIQVAPGGVWRWYDAGAISTRGPFLDLCLDLAWTSERRDARRSGDLSRIGLALRSIRLARGG